MTATPRIHGFRQLPDKRDRNYPMSVPLALAAAAHVPPPITKSWWSPAVFDQGNQPQCVGYATYMLLCMDPVRLIGTSLDFSPGSIYAEARANDEFDDDETDGTSIRAGLEVLRRYGLISAYYWASSPDEVVQHLATVGPVSIGAPWLRDMNTPNGDGTVSVTGGSTGGHNFLLSGYDSQTGVIECINSWGPQWGINGKFLMSYGGLERLFDLGAVAASVREIEQPTGN